MICPKCSKTLLAREGVLHGGRKYHRQCWTCAQCSIPLGIWVRKPPMHGDYLCNTCHIRTNGVDEGMIYATWKRKMKSNTQSNIRPSTLADDLLIF